MNMKNFQRKGSPGNAQVGSEFERKVFNFFDKRIKGLSIQFSIGIGHSEKKLHIFDMGSKKEKVVVKCKSHTWTESGNVPSEKLATWDQAMLYFNVSPLSYRKIFVVLKDIRPTTKESLLLYYLRLHSHLIPDDVEFWEWDTNLSTGKKMSIDRDKSILWSLDKDKDKEQTFLRLLDRMDSVVLRTQLQVLREESIDFPNDSADITIRCPEGLKKHEKHWEKYQQWVKTQFNVLFDRYYDRHETAAAIRAVHDEKSTKIDVRFRPIPDREIAIFTKQEFQLQNIIYSTGAKLIIYINMGERERLEEVSICRDRIKTDYEDTLKHLIEARSSYSRALKNSNIPYKIEHYKDNDAPAGMGKLYKAEYGIMKSMMRSIEILSEDIKIFSKQSSHTRLFPLILKPVFEAFSHVDADTFTEYNAISDLFKSLGYVEEKSVMNPGIVKNWREIYDNYLR
ncbi:hypothetical protein HQ531_03905 [bacterium]|nr:hypothetical protein [bacterium]